MKSGSDYVTLIIQNEEIEMPLYLMSKLNQNRNHPVSETGPSTQTEDSFAFARSNVDEGRKTEETQGKTDSEQKKDQKLHEHEEQAECSEIREVKMGDSGNEEGQSETGKRRDQKIEEKEENIISDSDNSFFDESDEGK